ncbi:aspartate aminotransferase family protein [Propionibacteriaceae bacterium Y2011]|uniref:aspartate aminotransferase family protein n=1 Tax=Microlunatus sp. Y2014 TaxID=3418488 RepID=UPI003B4D40F3
MADRTTDPTWTERAAKVLPGGVSSNVRLPVNDMVFDRGEGPRLYDLDGRDYVDYLLGQGPAFMGHGHPAVNEAVSKAVTKGMVFGAQHTLEIEATEKLLGAIGWADMARLGVSGSESDHGALRLARGATGRRLVIRFAGLYHGWYDTVLMNWQGNTGTVASKGQLEHNLADWLVLPYNDLAAAKEAFAQRGDEIAAVILEPMVCNSGALLPVPGFLEGLRELCTDNGSVLIFDEVITGFRLAYGGAAQRFGVTPDLGVYGKALAGGWPVSALAGRRDLMELLGTGEVNHSGTFNASVMAAAAVDATMDWLKENDPYPALEEFGTKLKDGLAEVGRRLGANLHIQGLPMAFHVSFADDDAPATDNASLATLDLARYAAFTDDLAEAGIWVAARGIYYVSITHGQAELDDTLERFEQALGKELARR